MNSLKTVIVNFLYCVGTKANKNERRGMKQG